MFRKRSVVMGTCRLWQWLLWQTVQAVTFYIQRHLSLIRKKQLPGESGVRRMDNHFDVLLVLSFFSCSLFLQWLSQNYR